ncbi:MAG: outer membrane protein [Bacteroidia bacterium]|jgi:outer membrane protein
MRNLLILTISLFISSLVLAQESVPMELGVHDAVKYAWENSQKAKNAAIDVQQADKEVWIQAARGLPIVKGNFGFNNFLDLPTSVFDASAFNPLAAPGELAELQFGQPYTMEAGINVGLQLFDGSYIIGIKGAKGYQKLIRDMEKMTNNEVKTMIAQAYYTSQIAKENVRLLNENIANMDKTLKETSALYEEGFAEEMDVEQLDLLINQIKNRAKQAQRQHEATLNLLKYQMGMPIDTKITLSDDLETLWGMQSDEELMALDLDLNNNLQYDLIKQDVVMHGYLVKLEEAKYYPTLHAFFDYKHQAFRDKFDFFDFDKSWYPQTLWGVKLNVPIWDNLGGLASINKAKLEQQKIKNRLVDTENALKLQEITAKSDFTSALEQLLTSTANIALASRIKEKMLIRYQEGMSTSMELTTAENQLIQAQTEYINTLFKAMDAKIQMKVVLENN